jgi:hypothetical protein
MDISGHGSATHRLRPERRDEHGQLPCKTSGREMQGTDGNQNYPPPMRSVCIAAYRQTGKNPREPENQQPDSRQRHCPRRRGVDIRLIGHARMRRLTSRFSGGAPTFVPWHFIHHRPLQPVVRRHALRSDDLVHTSSFPDEGDPTAVRSRSTRPQWVETSSDHRDSPRGLRRSRP